MNTSVINQESNNSGVKLIIFLYSIFSAKSKQLASTIPIESRKNFKFLSVDSQFMRTKIKNSTTLKVKTVPCIILMYNDGVVSTFENEFAGQVVENIISLSTKEPFAIKENTTKLNIGKNVEDMVDSDHIDEEEPVRKKRVRIANNRPQQMAMSSKRYRPEKGNSHNTMAVSSLQNKKNQIEDETYEDLDEMLNIEDTGPRPDKKKAMENVMKSAMKMANMRKETEQDEEEDDGFESDEEEATFI